MGWTTVASGSQTCVLGTEHVLNSPTTIGTYEFLLDTVNMVAGDYIEARVYDMIDGSNYRQIWKGGFANQQSNVGKKPPAISIMVQGKFTLKLMQQQLTFSAITGTLTTGTNAIGHTSAATGTYYTFGPVTQTTGTSGVLQHTSGVWTPTGEDVYINTVTNKVTVANGGFAARAFPWAIRMI